MRDQRTAILIVLLYIQGYKNDFITVGLKNKHWFMTKHAALLRSQIISKKLSYAVYTVLDLAFKLSRTFQTTKQTVICSWKCKGCTQFGHLHLTNRKLNELKTFHGVNFISPPLCKSEEFYAVLFFSTSKYCETFEFHWQTRTDNLYFSPRCKHLKFSWKENTKGYFRSENILKNMYEHVASSV